MIIKANELTKYMQMHGIDKVPVEVVNTDLPECKELRQGARHLAKKLIILDAQVSKFGGNPYAKPKNYGIDAVRVNYVMYNSFKKSQCYLPVDWELDVLTGDAGEKVLKEYAEHSGNLEQKFRDAFNTYHPQIQEKLEAAAKLIDEAEKISEDNGIPFSSHLMSSTGYVPGSFDSMYQELMEEGDADVVHELTGMYNTEYTGWQTSSTNC